MNGVLFDKEKATLISCPQTIRGVYRVPDGVVKIGNGAFSGCAELTNITGWKRDGGIEWDLMRAKEDSSSKGKDN